MKEQISFLRQYTFLAVVVICLLLAGCGTYRPISNPGYPGHYRSQNPLYKGELSEFDVIGIEPGTVSEQDIKAALEKTANISIPRGSAVLLIQSGALIPDVEMNTPLAKYFTVGTFSGIPGSDKNPNAGERSRAIRYAAAKGGYERIICYWGVLETAQKRWPTKPVSWVPLAGWAIPDERQSMRIRLKVAIVDVSTGKWSIFSPQPFEDRAISNLYTRRQSDQKQVGSLKEVAYRAAVAEIVQRYAN